MFCNVCFRYQTSNLCESGDALIDNADMTSKLDKQLEQMQPFLKSLIVFVNPKSGGQKGVYLKYLNIKQNPNTVDILMSI